jgi:hypothetical protein
MKIQITKSQLDTILDALVESYDNNEYLWGDCQYDRNKKSKIQRLKRKLIDQKFNQIKQTR